LIEGNPRDCYLEKHYSIFDLKASHCLALDILNSDTFFIMDDCHTIYKLTRNENNRRCVISNEMNMREITRLEFTPQPFENIILRERYGIYKSKLFFFYNSDDGPWPEGMLEAEELMENLELENLQLLKGPIAVRGSN
jgi:hypothetical protein